MRLPSKCFFTFFLAPRLRVWTGVYERARDAAKGMEKGRKVVDLLRAEIKKVEKKFKHFEVDWKSFPENYDEASIWNEEI